jgi:transcriptional regulator with XRE-family HTH domain
MPTLGEIIRQRRTELGYTQEALAERISDGLRQADISRLENDHVTLPRRARLEKIAKALDLPVGLLLAQSGWTGAETEITAGQRDEPTPLPTELEALEKTVAQVHDLVHEAETLLDDAKTRVAQQA